MSICKLPSDPFLLLSTINTKLRDFYPNLEALCEDLDADKNEIMEALASINYTYDEKRNYFV